jgi:hypothetical protein
MFSDVIVFCDSENFLLYGMILVWLIKCLDKEKRSVGIIL